MFTLGVVLTLKGVVIHGGKRESHMSYGWWIPSCMCTHW